MQQVRTPLRPPRAHPAGLMAKFFRGLGDPTRVRVLQLLWDRELTVSELVGGTGVLQGRLSSHLACLRWCGFVAVRKEGRHVYYRLADQRVRRLLELAQEFLDQHCREVEMCRIIDGQTAPPPQGDGHRGRRGDGQR